MVKTRTTESEGFPRVFKNNEGLLQIVYSNHGEFYRLTKKFYDCDGEKYDVNKELEMVEGSGMYRVRGNKTIITHDFTEMVTQDKIELVAKINKLDSKKLEQALVHFGVFAEVEKEK